MNTCDGKPVTIGDEFAIKSGQRWTVGTVEKVSNGIALLRRQSVIRRLCSFRVGDFREVGDCGTVFYRRVRRVDDEVRAEIERDKRADEIAKANMEFRSAVTWCDPVEKLGLDVVRELTKKLLT